MRVLLLATAACVGTMVAIRFTAPWDLYMNGWGGAFYSLIAKARLQSGSLDIAAPQTVAAGAEQMMYLNHPPLGGILVAIVFGVLGVGEWQARTVALACAGISLFFFYSLVRRAFSTSIARISLIVLLSTPMFGAYADFVADHGFIILASLLAVLFFLQRYLDGHESALPAGAAAGAISLLSDYPIAFLVAGLVVGACVPGVHWKRVLQFTAGLVFALLVTGVAYVAYLRWEAGSLDFLFNQLALRVGLASGPHITAVDWIVRIAHHQVPLYSPFVLGCVVLALVSAGVGAWKSRAQGWPRKNHRHVFWPVVLIVLGAGYVIVGNEGSYVHEYWSIYLLPGYALIAGLYLDRVLRGKAIASMRWIWLAALGYAALFAGRLQPLGADLSWRTGIILSLGAVVALIPLAWSRRLVPLVVLIFVALNVLLTRQIVAGPQSDLYATLGTEIRAATKPDDLIITTGNAVPQLEYYSDRLVVPNSFKFGAERSGWQNLVDPDKTLDSFGNFVAMNWPAYVLVVEGGYYPGPQVREWLDKHCAYRPVTAELLYVQSCGGALGG